MKDAFIVQDQNGTSLRKQEILRPLANFTPNLWGDLFLHYTSLDSVILLLIFYNFFHFYFNFIYIALF